MVIKHCYFNQSSMQFHVFYYFCRMIKWIFGLLIPAVAILLTAHFLQGVHVENFGIAIFASIILGLLNMFVKPILTFLTFPITVVTLGLFLFVLNALMIMVVSNTVDGFHVENFWWALIFSLIVSIINSILNSFIGNNE